MTAAMSLRNLEAYGVQAALLILAGVLLARLFRIEQPRAALVYWRTLLVACLLLPLCQPWHPSIIAPTIVTGAAAVSDHAVNPPVLAAAPAARERPSLERLVWIAIAVGIALRAAWLAIGAWMLRTIRREAATLDPLPEPIATAQQRIGVSAEVYVSERIAGPITFGVRRPAIVFPPGVGNLDPSVQHAIACHELLHVRRRDWVAQVLEESLRSVCWFHPPIWWLIGRIQLTREQVVDQEVVQLLDSRERYIEALLAVAIAKSPGLFTPAPAFFRRSLLKRRVAQILQESTMTTRRLIVSLAVSAGAAGTGGHVGGPIVSA
jgi:beta-lactamase regulating signal transducer with metallopeptidase domain